MNGFDEYKANTLVKGILGVAASHYCCGALCKEACKRSLGNKVSVEAATTQIICSPQRAEGLVLGHAQPPSQSLSAQVGTCSI